MDSVTQALLGAAIGQACAGHRLGRRAAWWGALAGTLPDADVFISIPFDEFTSMWTHRGESHALWFGPVVGTALGYGLWRFERFRARRAAERAGLAVDYEQKTQEGTSWTSREALSSWILLFILAILTHPLLDAFTSYGTQLLAPFSRQRFAFDGVGIIDPIYSLILIVALILGSRFRRAPERAARVGRVALALSTAYLFLGLGLTYRAKSYATAQLEAAGYSVDSIEGYTSVFQNGLKRLVARSGDQVFVGHVSAWRPSPISWQYFRLETDPAVQQVLKHERGQLFAWFADQQLGWASAPAGDKTQVQIEDLRYGMPGSPQHSMWGIEAYINARGEVESVRRMRRPRVIQDGQLGDIFRAAFGHDPRTFQVGVGGGFQPVDPPKVHPGA